MLIKFFNHSFLYGIGPQVPRLVNLLILPIVTPYLTPLDYGIQSVLSSTVGLLSGLSELGLSLVLVNSFYEYRYNERWKYHWKIIYGFLSVWFVFYGLLCASFVFLIMPSEAFTNKLTIVLIIFSQNAFFSCTSLIAGRLYQMLEKPSYLTFVSMATGFITILMNLITIKYLNLGYMSWYYSGLVGSLFSFCFYVFPLVKKYKIKPDLNFSKKYIFRKLRITLPSIPHNYSSYLLDSSDKLIMNRLSVPINDLGGYTVGYTFGSYFNIIGSAVGMAQGPLIAKLWFKRTLESKKQIRLIFFVLQILFFCVGFIFALWSKELLPMLFRNKSFEDSYTIASIVVMSYIYFPMYWGSIDKLFYENKTMHLWKISAIAGLSNLILNVIFIPIYGPLAAAVTTFICMLYMSFSGYFMRAYKNIEDVNYYPIMWIVFFSLSTLCVFYLRDSSINIKILVSTFILILLFLAFLFFKVKVKMFLP